VKDVVSCFSDDALVRDEGKDFRGKKTIEDWVVKTIEKYKFRFKPLAVKSDEAKIVVSVRSIGNFSWEPSQPDYHFND